MTEKKQEKRQIETHKDGRKVYADQIKIKFKAPKNWISETGIIIKHKPYVKYHRTDIDSIFAAKGVQDKFLQERQIVAQVFPFKINQQVIDLIDWDNYQNDPLFQLTFPQPEMLDMSEINSIKKMYQENASREEIAEAISVIRDTKNPAPAGQAYNRPLLEDDNDVYECDGLQHKYEKTCLLFHKNAQTCHAYCTYCFRFNQFVGKDKFLEPDTVRLNKYLAKHKEISDILITGGDPGTMKADVFKQILEPLTEARFSHITNIRIGTKALTYHPYRFLTDPDADELIDCFADFIRAGKHISIMAHFSHYNELSNATIEAVRRLRSIGCNIRTQAPIMKHINDSAEVWATMWKKQIQYGMIPYYMFLARDTGPQKYFEIPLAQALKIFKEARNMMSGLGHTARGPSMSTTPGKILVVGEETIAGERVFILKFTQARVTQWCDRVFFAKYDEKATWLDNLQPAFGEKKFFFEDEYTELMMQKKSQLKLGAK
jgi:KamA family protein